MKRADGILGWVSLMVNAARNGQVKSLLFNDSDDGFPAKCSVLFKVSTEKYLDGESLARFGRLLFKSLKEKSGVVFVEL